MQPHLRRRTVEGQETTTVELFFDLVYVLAITQLSHLLIGDLSWGGAARATFLLVVVWWAWVNTTWAMNWLDPADLPVRIVVLVAALASLVMASALPTAFGEHAGLFAGAYVVLQVGRDLCGVALTRGHGLQAVFEALSVWGAVAGVLWIAGALLDGEARSGAWIAALAVNLAAPAAGYPLPGRGRVDGGDLPMAIEGGHLAERFQLFIIIALGESVVVTGATAADKGLTTAATAALAVAFVQTATLWWLYFDASAVFSRRQMRDTADASALARDGYVYLHLPIIAGIIVVAVGDDLLLAHPQEALAGTSAAIATLGGPVLYLLGTLAFRLRMIGRVGAKRPLAVGMLVALGALAGSLAALELAVLVAGVLLGLALWEHEGARAKIASRTKRLGVRSGP